MIQHLMLNQGDAAVLYCFVGFSEILGMLAVLAVGAAIAILFTQFGSAGAATKEVAAQLEAAWIFCAHDLSRQSKIEVWSPMGRATERAFTLDSN